MNIDQPTIWIIVGAIAIVYCAIRFVLLPWFVPRLLDSSGTKLRGGGDEKAPAKGASHSEAWVHGKQAEHADADRALADRSGVPLEIIHAFRRENPDMHLTAEVALSDDVGPRFRVSGSRIGSDVSARRWAEHVYRLDGTLDHDDDDEPDEDEALEIAEMWEALPEHIRAAARATVPGGEFVDRAVSDDEDPCHKICMRTSFEHWVLEIDTDGRVLRTNKRRASGAIAQS